MVLSIAGPYPVAAIVTPRLMYYPWIAVKNKGQSIIRAKLPFDVRDAINRTQDAPQGPHRDECVAYLKGMK
jgi:hypothetical protein